MYIWTEMTYIYIIYILNECTKANEWENVTDCIIL
jgi:hypothetical protein